MHIIASSSGYFHSTQWFVSSGRSWLANWLGGWSTFFTKPSRWYRRLYASEPNDRQYIFPTTWWCDDALLLLPFHSFYCSIVANISIWFSSLSITVRRKLVIYNQTNKRKPLIKNNSLVTNLSKLYSEHLKDESIIVMLDDNNYDDHHHRKSTTTSFMSKKKKK